MSNSESRTIEGSCHRHLDPMSVDCVYPQLLQCSGPGTEQHWASISPKLVLDNTPCFLVPPAQCSSGKMGGTAEFSCLLPSHRTQHTAAFHSTRRLTGKKSHWSLCKAPQHPRGKESLDSNSIINSINYLLTTEPLRSIHSRNSCDSPKGQTSAIFPLGG